MNRLSRASALTFAAALVGIGAATADPSAGAGNLRLKPLGSFDQPDYVAQPPGSKHLVYVVEKAGTIQVVRNGQVASDPFLDIGDRVNTFADDGMGSMAFDPNYRQNRRFYVMYTTPGGANEVDVFKRSPGSPERAVASSRRQVILIPHPDSGEHNGGQLQFGADGHLYISMGDGGCCNDPGDHAYKLHTLLGKILRIDPHPAGGYTVPKDNPLVGKPGRNEIFAWGLRNPWRFSFDRKTGRLVIGDVGDATEEEIDYTTVAGATGANFGWPEYEGDLQVDPLRPGPGTPVPPIQTYSHGQGCSVIGGYVVRDKSLGSLDGRYVYSDLCSGDLRVLTPHLGGASADTSLGLTVPDPGSTGYRTSSFGEGTDGRIFIASIDGPVYRLVSGH